MNDKYYFGLTNQYNLLPSYSSPSKDEKKSNEVLKNAISLPAATTSVRKRKMPYMNERHNKFMYITHF